MPTSLFSTAYFAPVQWYVHFNQCNDPVLEANEHYIKQTWRNRCVIATANGPMSLSMPIVSVGTKGAGIRDIRLSEHGNWQRLHWYSIESAYNSSPFFEYYQDDLRPFFEQKPGFLFEFNEAIRAKICDLMGIATAARCTTDYVREGELPEEWVDYRSLIHPKKDSSTEDPTFNARPYYQVFDRKFGFIPNLSILDLLFNMGPESILYL